MSDFYSLVALYDLTFVTFRAAAYDCFHYPIHQLVQWLPTFLVCDLLKQSYSMATRALHVGVAVALRVEGVAH